MNKKIVSFSLTNSLLRDLNILSEKTGLSKSDLVRRSLEEYLEKNNEKGNE